MFEIEYMTDRNGNFKSVVIPIELWKQILPTETDLVEELSERIENYCLNKAMNEAQQTPLLDYAEALKYLEE